MLEILPTITVAITGVLVGVEFAVAAFINPIFNRLPRESALAARSDGARLLGRVMPFWYVGSLLLTVGWAILTWGNTAGGLALTGAALLAASVLLSVLLLVPINSRAANWSASSAPDDWAQQLQAWDRLHYIRVAIILTGLIMLVIALQK